MAFRPLPSNFESFQGQTRGPGTYDDNGYNSGNETPEYNEWGKRVLGAGGTVFSPDSIGFLNGAAYHNEGSQQFAAGDNYFEQNYPFMPAEQIAAAKAQSYRDKSGNLWIPNNFTQRAYYESPYQNKDSWLDKLFAAGPMIASAAFLGPSIFGGFGAAGAGLAEGTAAGLAGAGESIMAGGYGANLAASGAGFGAGATGLSLAELGAGSLLGGGAGSVLAGGAGALGLSAETVAAMQALGYSGAEIASMGGNVLNGFDAMQAAASGGSLPINIPDVPSGVPRPDSSYNPDASSTGPSSTTNPTGIPGAPLPLSTFDKFLNGILDNPIKSALSAGQILSGISTANRAMSPQQAQAMADPFSPYRQQYINQLNAVMANPALAMSQPGYQFQRQQGEQAIDRKLAARGMGSYTPDGRGSASGGADIARIKYGQEYALGSYNDYVKQLSGLAGATQAPGVGGQAAISAQAAAAKAATEGWGAINQGIGTMQGIMNAAPSGNPNNSGWSTPATPGFQGAFPGGVPYSDMPAYSGNIPSNTATGQTLQQPPAGSYASGTSGGWGPYSNWFTPPVPGERGYAPPGYMVAPTDGIIKIEDYNAMYGSNPKQPAYDTQWD